MNVLVYFFAALICFGLAYRYYGRLLSRVFGINPQRKTPAVELTDGRDYVPTRPSVVFAHHYATIAGAGPIVGPTLGILYGVGPTWLWIVLGAIFIGGVHDFVALFTSLREKGSSMAEVARRALGPTGFLLFIVFTIIMIVLVTSAFLSLTAVSLTSIRPLSQLGLEPSQTLLRVEHVNGVANGVVGGIASMSVIIITLLAPGLGYLVTRKGLKTSYAYTLATLIGIFSIYVGFHFPVSLNPITWMVIISIYTLFACEVPVWIILQPRDFVNVQILYGGMVALIIGIIISGLHGAAVVYPVTNYAAGAAKMGPIWPFMFITIACGSISGFHALVAGGTSSKQVAHENEARPIAYGGMLLEGVLAVLVILTIGSSLTYGQYMSVAWPEVGKGNPILAFAISVGHLLNGSLGISLAVATVLGILIVEGFLITTLDSAVRLNRYLFEELWKTILPNPPAIMRQFWFNSGLSVVLMLLLALSNGWKLIWPVFGATNQLLAALTLIATTVWLNRAGRKTWYTLAPAIVMMITTVWALSYALVSNYIPHHNVLLAITSLILLALAIGVAVLAVRELLHLRTVRETPASA